MVIVLISTVLAAWVGLVLWAVTHPWAGVTIKKGAWHG